MKRLAVVVAILSVLTIPALAITITDSPPSLTLYTKTGLHVVKITATAKDDVEVKFLKVYVNDIPVLIAHKDKYKFTVDYKHKLKDALREITKWFETGEVSFKDWRLRHRITEDHKRELSVKDYPIVLPPGDFLIKTVAIDNAGHMVTKTARVKIIRDYPPSIHVSTPPSVRTNSESAKVNVNVNAKDDLGLKSIELYVDNKLLRKIEVNKKSYSAAVTLTVTGIGKHEIKAVATDTGNEKAHDVARIELIKNQPPTVKIETIENTRTITDRANVEFTISYSDDVRVTKIVLYVDGNLISEVRPNKAPGSLVKTVSLPLGEHEVKVTATDDMSLRGVDIRSFSVVRDHPPSVDIISPKDEAVIWTTDKTASVTIKARASDDFGVKSVEYYIDGKRVGSGASVKVNLHVGSHTIRAVVTDTAGQTSSDSVRVTVKRDNPPHVSITTPKNGEVFWTTSGRYTLTIKATASDDRSVKRVEFYVDGKKTYTDTKAPYETKATLRVGNHKIEARAIDTSGQVRSSIVSIVVRKDNPPSVRITSPKNGAVFWTKSRSCTVTITATARDDRGVKRVEFYIDGNRITTDSKAPYQTTTTLNIGRHTLKVVTIDTVGQLSQDFVTITVKKRVVLPNIKKLTVPEIHWSAFLPKDKVVVIGKG